MSPAQPNLSAQEGKVATSASYSAPVVFDPHLGTKCIDGTLYVKRSGPAVANKFTISGPPQGASFDSYRIPVEIGSIQRSSDFVEWHVEDQGKTTYNPDRHRGRQLR